MSENSKNIRNEKRKISIFPRIMIGGFSGVSAYFFLVAVFSYFSLKLGFENYFIIGIISGYISGLLAGYVGVRPIKEKGLLYGGLSGVVTSLVCCLIVFFVNFSSAGKGLFILSGTILLSSVIGGITAVNLKIKKKY